MAEPVRNDEPLSSIRFPESPASAKADHPGPVPVTTLGEHERLLPERGTDKPLGEWPASSGERSYSYPEARDAEGQSPGSTVASIFGRAKADLRNRVHDLRHRLHVVRRRMDSGEYEREVRQRASELSDRASDQARYARNRAEFYARNYPLRVIAGAVVAGFSIGFLLRMWRDE